MGEELFDLVGTVLGGKKRKREDSDDDERNACWPPGFTHGRFFTGEEVSLSGQGDIHVEGTILAEPLSDECPSRVFWELRRWFDVLGFVKNTIVTDWMRKKENKAKMIKVRGWFDIPECDYRMSRKQAQAHGIKDRTLLEADYDVESMSTTGYTLAFLLMFRDSSIGNVRDRAFHMFKHLAASSSGAS